MRKCTRVDEGVAFDFFHDIKRIHIPHIMLNDTFHVKLALLNREDRGTAKLAVRWQVKLIRRRQHHYV